MNAKTNTVIEVRVDEGNHGVFLDLSLVVPPDEHGDQTETILRISTDAGFIEPELKLVGEGTWEIRFRGSWERKTVFQALRELGAEVARAFPASPKRPAGL